MRRSNKLQSIILIIISFFVITVTSYSALKREYADNGIKKDRENGKNIKNEYIYGLTIDDSWDGKIKVSQIIDAIKELPVKPTVRIVMSKNIRPENYEKLFKDIHEVAYIMATPVDSYEMKKYNLAAYLDRFRNSYEILGKYVDIWEIGNEVNGEKWLGNNPKLISDKVYAAYRYISSQKGKTALTAYYFAPGEQKTEMIDWLNEYIPSDMKKNIDFVFVSYYEDDNKGYQPKWKEIFQKLEILFPNSKLGIGECGNTDKNATTKSKIKMINHYYTMPKYVKNYVGGYFWWYWVQDAVPHKENEVWKAFYNNMGNHK